MPASAESLRLPLVWHQGEVPQLMPVLALGLSESDHGLFFLPCLLSAGPGAPPPTDHSRRPCLCALQSRNPVLIPTRFILSVLATILCFVLVLFYSIYSVCSSRCNFVFCFGFVAEVVSHRTKAGLKLPT